MSVLTTSGRSPGPSTRRVRVAFLQKAPSGHNVACLQALTDSHGVDLFLTLPNRQADAPFDDAIPTGAAVVHPQQLPAVDEKLVEAVREFAPDILLIVGWEVPAYRHCARAFRGACLRVVCMDNQWNRTPRQMLGVATRRLYIRPYFDAAFVAGERQRTFAGLLGFAQQNIFDGFYSCDCKSFVPDLASLNEPNSRRSFVFVGRLVPEKGIEELIAAYKRYRSQVADPWPLIVAGEGPLADLFEGVSGIEHRGFVQPRDLPALFRQAAFLILPSRFEPWGVVVHEAVTAGLGVIATSAVGAADLFVQPGVNGQVIKPNDETAITGALKWAHALSDEERVTVAQTSLALSSLRSPSGWVSAISDMSTRWHSMKASQ